MNEENDEELSEYEQLLSRKEWKSKRRIILERDQHRCQMCGKESRYLNVHHKYYKYGLNPWEYSNESLITLCQDCHFQWHDNHEVRVIGGKICPRCNGKGYFSQYKNINHGICFKCKGFRYIKVEETKIQLEAEELIQQFNKIFKQTKKENLFDNPRTNCIDDNIEKCNKELEKVEAICDYNDDSKITLKGQRIDQYGGVYTVDYKVLLKIPSDVVNYNILPGTEIIANGAFDHFEIDADSEACYMFNAALECLFIPKTVKYICDSAFGEDGKNLLEVRVEENERFFRESLPKFSKKISNCHQPFIHKSKHDYFYDNFGGIYSKNKKELLYLMKISDDQNIYNVLPGTKIIHNVGSKITQHIVLPYGIEVIPKSAFEYVKIAGISIPQSVKHIGQWAFLGCMNIKNIEIPSSVKIIEDRAFAGCKNLRSIKFNTIKIATYDNNIDQPRENYLYLEKGCFDRCDSLDTIYIPKLDRFSDSLIWNKMTKYELSDCLGDLWNKIKVIECDV